MSAVIICFPSAGLPSRLSLRTPVSRFLAWALVAIKVPAPMAEHTAAREAISFLRLKSEVMINLLRFYSLCDTFIHFEISGQCETENVTSGRDRHVLLVLNCVAHGRGTEILSHVEMPQSLSVLGIHGLERLRVIAEEN